jgi:hypothetical protein
MEKWEDRFFALNRTNETELKGVPLSLVFRGLHRFGWKRDDEIFAPDLQVSRFIREEDEIFVIQETYFDPKLTGDASSILELSNAITEIDPNE